MVLLWSRTSWPKLDHKGTSSGRCVPAGTMHRFINFMRINQSFNDKFNLKCIKYPMHSEILCTYLKPINDIEMSNLTCPYIRPKKLKFSWFDFFIYFLQYLHHVTLICKNYSKFMKELVEFINDLSITCSICSTEVFDWYLCPVICDWYPLCYLCKLYHETDRHLFDEYKHKKPLWNQGHNHTQGTTRNVLWVFFQEHTHPLIETSSRCSYNSQDFDLDNLFYF